MSEKMEVLAITDSHRCEVRTVTRPQPGAGEVLIKIDGCALCTYEQRMFTRQAPTPLPVVGGHEIAGEIAGTGSGVSPEEYPVGKKVAVRLISSCGKCYFCRRGEENLCAAISAGKSRQSEIPGSGGLGQYVAVPVGKVWEIPQDLPVEQAVFAEPLACVLNSIEKGQIQLGDDAVVIGGGIMGMLHVMCAKLSGARVTLSEPDPERRRLAEELGCDFTVNPLETDPAVFLKSITKGLGAEAVFNTTPISAVAAQAVSMAAPMGRVVMYSSQHPDHPVEISPNWLHKTETVITGAVSPSIRSFDRAVNLISKGLIDTGKLVSGVFDYRDGTEAFEAAIRPDTFRIVVRFS